MKSHSYHLPYLFLIMTILFSLSSFFAQFPAFAPPDVSDTQDRDQMLWQLVLSHCESPPKSNDPNAPPETDPANVINQDSILPSVTFSVTTSAVGEPNQNYIEKVITGTIDVARYPQMRNIPKISAFLCIPANTGKPVPVIIGRVS